MEWRSLLREYLIEGGTDGRKQRDIVKRLQSFADADTIITTLNIWLEQDKVQIFNVPSGPRGGRPATVWRATELIYEDKS